MKFNADGSLKSFHGSTAKPRKKPKAGDRKTVKGVEYVRRQEMVDGTYCILNGRPVWIWIRVDKDREGKK